MTIGNANLGNNNFVHVPIDSDSDPLLQKKSNLEKEPLIDTSKSEKESSLKKTDRISRQILAVFVCISIITVSILAAKVFCAAYTGAALVVGITVGIIAFAIILKSTKTGVSSRAQEHMQTLAAGDELNHHHDCHHADN